MNMLKVMGKYKIGAGTKVSLQRVELVSTSKSNSFESWNVFKKRVYKEETPLEKEY